MAQQGKSGPTNNVQWYGEFVAYTIQAFVGTHFKDSPTFVQIQPDHKFICNGEFLLYNQLLKKYFYLLIILEKRKDRNVNQGEETSQQFM